MSAASPTDNPMGSPTTLVANAVGGPAQVSSATSSTPAGAAATTVVLAASPTAGTPLPTASSTAALIVVANVALVPAPTATRAPIVALSQPKPTVASLPRPTSVPIAAVAEPQSADAAAGELYCVDLINAQRAALGLPALAADPTLMGIANSRVADMVARGYTGHNDPITGVALGPALMAAAGFHPSGENWYGSRLGPPSIADVAMKWFMTDAPHYQNILNPRYTGVGVGIAFNGQQWLLIQDFGGS
jgi:uncharacterized protein YkwD